MVSSSVIRSVLSRSVLVTDLLSSIQLGVSIIKDGVRRSEVSHNVVWRRSEIRVIVPAVQHQFIAAGEMG